MTPPELARNTPRLDIGHPMIISLFPIFRNETRRILLAVAMSALNSRNGLSRQLFGIHKPLIRQERFNDNAGAISDRLLDFLIFDFDQEPFGLNIGDNRFTGFETIHADIFFWHDFRCDHLAP